MAAIAMLNLLSIVISADPNTKKSPVVSKKTAKNNPEKSSKGKNSAGKENSLSVTPNNQDIKNGAAGAPENSGQKNAEFVPPAAAANAGVFDFEKIHDYKIDHGPNKGKVAPIFGMRIRLEQDNAQGLKKMLALSEEEAEKIRVLPEKEKYKKISDWYEKLYQNMNHNPKLVDALYAHINNDFHSMGGSKHLFDPEFYDRASDDGFLSGFYIPGEDSSKDPIVMVHGGPNGSGVAMLPMGAELSKTTGRSVMVYTQRGCRGSGVSFDPGKDSFTQSAQDLKKGIDVTLALSGKEKVALLAHSFGTALSMEYLGTMDEGKVSSYIAAGPAETDITSAIRMSLKRKESRAKNKSIITKEKNPFIQSNLAGSVDLTGFSDLKKAREYFERIRKSNDITLLYSNADTYELSKNIRCSNNWAIDRDLFKRHRKVKTHEVLNNIKVPTLLIAGEHDSLDPKSAKITADKIPHSELCVMKDAAHWMFDEKPEEFCSQAKNFMERVDAGEKIGTGKVKDLESVGKKHRIQEAI